jgi:NADH dehydrogenase [ubiquinone] 1 alpha subcomplex assembly factor 7
LENVGEADLSADVDFGKIVHHFPETRFHLSGPMPQMEFLEACGIKSRLAALLNISSISTDTKRTLQSGVDRLIDPKGMGQSYKVFAAITK